MKHSQFTNKILVWDLSTRVLHWALAISLSASLGIALLVDCENPDFQYHMIFGLVAVFVVLLRIILGLLGSRHARFANFPLKPREIIGYFGSVLRAHSSNYAGNNPGAASAAIGMFLLVPLIVISGVYIDKEAAEGLHSVLAYILLAVIGAHVSGLLLHTLRHKENIAASMITGKKAAAPKDGIRSAYPVTGVLVALALVAWTTALFRGHNPKAGTVQIPLLGKTITLSGEEGKGESNHSETKNKHREGDHD